MRMVEGWRVRTYMERTIDAEHALYIARGVLAEHDVVLRLHCIDPGLEALYKRKRLLTHFPCVGNAHANER